MTAPLPSRTHSHFPKMEYSLDDTVIAGQRYIHICKVQAIKIVANKKTSWRYNAMLKIQDAVIAAGGCAALAALSRRLRRGDVFVASLRFRFTVAATGGGPYITAPSAFYSEEE